ncbi:ATP-dependent helicase [Luteococcus sp. Sow4_B9]|uniref:ATP-dependent helicase n=1 Tax=Luteococcus sp. Sow4_B9 TaxID=3438792 RepID=UPI003F9CF36C
MTGRQFLLTPPLERGVHTFTPDDDQRRVLEHRASASGGALLVVGGPGTGKTSTLVESVAARAVDGDLGPSLVLTWSRPAAQELRARIVRRLGRSQLAPKVMTVHGFCHALLRRHGAAEGEEAVRLLTAPEQEFRVRELLAGHDSSDWPQDLMAARSTRAFATEVRAVLARTRQLGMDPLDVAAAGRAAGRPEWVAVGQFYDEYLDVLDAEGAIDYSELVHRTRLLLLQTPVRESLQAELSTVHVDEFAEFDRAQIELLADLAGLGLDLVAFADPSTTVFAFRGAELRGVTDFAEIIGRGAIPTERIDLGVNHRNAADIVRACSGVSARLPRNGSGPAPRAGRAQARGRVVAQVHESFTAMVEHTAELLRTAHLDGGLDWSEMAVMTRSGRGDLPALSRGLAAAGVPVQVAGDDIALAGELSVRPLLMGLEAASDLARGKGVAPDLAARLLRSPLGGLDSLELRRLGRLLRRAESAEVDGEIPLTASAHLIAALVADPGAVPVALRESDEPSAELRRAQALGELLAQVGGSISRGGSAQMALWQLWNGTPWPELLRARALGGGDGADRAHRDLDAVCALFDLAARESHLVGEQGVRALVAEVSAQAIPADTNRESDLRDRGVRVVTAHRAKGEQWPLVVVAGVQEGTWPNLTRRGTLLEPDRISRQGVLPPNPTSTVLAEERRLFHLACSRATDTLVVCAVEGAEGEGEQPSRFLQELGVDVEWVPARRRRATTLPALVAELRCVCTDPTAAPALREAAAVRLARLSEETDPAGKPLVPGADPGSWWGILDHSQATSAVVEADKEITLSGSQVESLLDCPRHWFLARQARAEAQRGSAASLGSVVHVLAQHAMSDDLDLEDLTGHLDEVWGQMRFDAEWLSASERVEAQAALERFVAWADAAAEREVLGVEVAFRTTVQIGDEEIVLVGSVDRLERDGQGRLHVVDFKTGRTVPTQAHVDQMDQLGIYQLAAQQGAFDHLAPGERRVGGAELVYLRKQLGESPWPKVLTQPSLEDLPHGRRGQPRPDNAAEDGRDAEQNHPTWVHEHLDRAARTIRSERFEATRCDRCQFCPFALSCPAMTTAPEVGR